MALEAMAERMAEVLRHRGPDDHGVWADPKAGVALAHRRLSILDLSAAGHQPMFSSTGRFIIVYNGEEPLPTSFSLSVLVPVYNERYLAACGASRIFDFVT
jgi:hypothetical protein